MEKLWWNGEQCVTELPGSVLEKISGDKDLSVFLKKTLEDVIVGLIPKKKCSLCRKYFASKRTLNSHQKRCQRKTQMSSALKTELHWRNYCITDHLIITSHISWLLQNISMTHGFPTVKFSLIRSQQHTSTESCFLFSCPLQRKNTITVGYYHGDSWNFLVKSYSHFQCMVQPGKKWALC